MQERSIAPCDPPWRRTALESNPTPDSAAAPPQGAISPDWVQDELRGLASDLPEGPFRRDFEQYATSHAVRFASLLSRMRAHHRPGAARVLDAGSFPGHFTLLLARLGYDVTALSQPLGSPLPAEGFQQALRAARVECVECDLERGYAPLPADAFDAAVFSEVIEHLAFNPFHAFGEICRLLKPGGRLWLTTPNLASARYVLRLLRGRSIGVPVDGPWREAFPSFRGLKHEREYTAREIRHFLSPGDRCAHAFEEARVTGHGWLGDAPGGLGPRARRVESVVTRLFPRFGNALLATAVKPVSLRVFAPAELHVEGEWSETSDPVQEAQFPCAAAYPYPFRYLRGEARISFRLPADWAPGQSEIRLLLPWIWHVTDPPLPDQPILVEPLGAGDSLSRGMDPIRIVIRPDYDARIVSIPLGNRPASSAREVALRLRPERPIRPDDVLGNGDRVPTGPALAAAHWGLRRG